MTGLFSEKAVLIAGGGSGIGRAAALAFAREGAHVMVLDRAINAAKETVSAIEQQRGRAACLKVDVAQPEQVEEATAETIRHFGRLDVAVNSAGHQGKPQPVNQTRLNDFHRVFDVNLFGVLHCMKWQLQQMVSQANGAIVNIASLAASHGFPDHAAYCASKHAVLGLTRTAALECAKQGVRVNAVCPGFVRTPMLERVSWAAPDMEERLIAAIPMGRLAKPEEVAEAVLWLASERANYVTGQVLVIDGGLSIT